MSATGEARAVPRPTRALVPGGRTLIAGLLLLAVVVGLASLPLWGTSGQMRLAVEFLYLLALAQMWNLLAGYAGLVSIGQQAYVGLGGYALIMVADTLGLNVFVAVPLAGVVAMGIAVPTALLVFRLRGGFFAIGTWVVAEAFRILIANTPTWGGGSGTTLRAANSIPRETREAATLWLAIVVGVGSVALVYGLLRSRLGLALTAIRDEESAAESLGVNAFWIKLLVYLLAAFGTGVTGALVYLNLLRVQPEAAFNVNWTAYMIFIVVIGGIGTVMGPIVGTLVFFLLRQALADFGAWYLIVLGTVAIVAMLRAPRGLWGLVAARWDVDPFPVRRRLPPTALSEPLAKGLLP